jgi:uncharacterized membrane protein YbhN (UPF0104 family)
LNKKLIAGLLLKLCLTAALIWFLAGRHELRPSNLLKILTSANTVWLSISFLISFCLAFIQIIRWQEHLKVGKLNYTFKESAASWFAGNLLGFISPGRVAELGRGFFLDKSRIKECAKATFAERAFFIEAVFIMSTVSLFVTLAKFIPYIGTIKAVLSVSVLVLLSIFGAIAIWRGFKIKRIKRFGFFDFFPVCVEQRFYLITMSFILCIVMVFHGFIIFNAFHPVSLISSFVVTQVTMGALILFPVTIGNLGVREGVFVYLLSMAESMPPEYAVSAGLVVFIQNIVLPSIVGAFVILIKKQW